MSPVRRFVLATDTDAEQFVAGLEERTAVEREGTGTATRTVYDTFDWRLYGKATVLERLERDGTTEVRWRSLATGEVLARLELDDVPRFAWSLPSGPATNRIGELIEMRALLPLVSLTTRSTTLRHLDDERKTVARLVVDEVVAPEPAEVDDGTPPSPTPAIHDLATTISVVPLRGYDREAERLAAVLDAQVVLRPDADDPTVAALRAAGYEPGSYSSKLRTRLDPELTAAEAWFTMLRALRGAMRANEAGLRDDLDSEFLHDFRVAVRRTRSVLGEAKHILPAEQLAHFRTELKWLGTSTGPTRDLDVFLLDLADFAAELPAERRDDVKPFRSFLEDRQRETHAALVADLDSPRSRALIESWTRFLDDPPAPTDDEPDATRPATDVAAARIARAHKKMVTRGRIIEHGSHPELLHDLRKDAKRLRYLLECFGSLYPADEVGPIVKDLKGVQDVLGTYQDCQVQAGQLEGFAQEMLERDRPSAAAVMVIGLLVEQLDQRADAARADFHGRFAAFDRKHVRRAVRRLATHHPDGADEHTDASAAPTGVPAAVPDEPDQPAGDHPADAQEPAT